MFVPISRVDGKHDTHAHAHADTLPVAITTRNDLGVRLTLCRGCLKIGSLGNPCDTESRRDTAAAISSKENSREYARYSSMEASRPPQAELVLGIPEGRNGTKQSWKRKVEEGGD